MVRVTFSLFLRLTALLHLVGVMTLAATVPAGKPNNTTIEYVFFTDFQLGSLKTHFE